MTPRPPRSRDPPFDPGKLLEGPWDYGFVGDLNPPYSWSAKGEFPFTVQVVNGGMLVALTDTQEHAEFIAAAPDLARALADRERELGELCDAVDRLLDCDLDRVCEPAVPWPPKDYEHVTEVEEAVKKARKEG